MQNGVLTATYGYDPNGNRNSVATASGTKTATYDAQDRLLTYGSWSYTYTANGDLLTKTDTSNGQVTNYAYDAQGNLRHVSLPDGRAIDYVVDSQNRRVAKKVNGAVVKKWIYEDQLKPAAEFDGSGTLLSRYLDGVVIQGTTSYRVVADQLGTPRLLVNGTTGAVAQRMDFDEWGQVTSDSSGGFQVFGFAGGIYDSDTLLVRFGARDYDPTVGRWITKDPIGFAGGDKNLFGYALADPVNHVDHTGKETIACAAAIALCLARSGCNGYEKFQEIKRLTEAIQEINRRIRDLQEIIDRKREGDSCPNCGSPENEIERLQEEARQLESEEAKAHAFDAPSSHLKDAACGLLVVVACLAPAP